jgi:hypothetical protein
MALLKPNPNQEKISFKVQIGTNTVEEINAYCAWAGFKDQGEFIEKVINFMVEKDLDWKKFRRGAVEV